MQDKAGKGEPPEVARHKGDKTARLCAFRTKRFRFRFTEFGYSTLGWATQWICQLIVKFVSLLEVLGKGL